MRRVNKILVLFMFVMVVAFMLTWEFLQSRWVAKKVSTIATKYITEVLDAEIAFENLQFNLFPPGANVRNLTFEMEREKIALEVKANELGIYFSPLDVFETDFIADRMLISDGSVHVIETSKPTKPDENNDNSNTSTEEIFKLLPKVPLNKIQLQNILVKYRTNNLLAKELVLSNKVKSIGVEGTVESLDLSPYLAVPLFVDSIEVNANLSSQRVKVENLTVKSGFKTIELEGSIEDYLSSDFNYQLDLKALAPLNVLHNYVDLEGVGTLDQGVVSVKSRVSGLGEDFSVDAELEGQNLVTQFADADVLKAKLSLNKTNIIIKEIFLKNSESILELEQPFELYNLVSKKYIEEPVIAKFQNYDLRKALKYLKDDVGFLKGRLSTKLRFDLFDKESFSFKVMEPGKIHSLSLEIDEELDAFTASEFNLTEGDISLVRGDLDLALVLSKAENQMNINARTRDGAFEMEVPNSFINFKDFSPVLGYELKGKGLLDISISPSPDGPLLKLRNDSNRFEINDYAFDKIKSEVELNLDTSNLVLKKVYATSGKANIFARGEVDLKAKEINATYAVKEASFSEVKRVLAPLLKDVSITTNEIHGLWDLNGRLSGKPSVDGLIVDGNFKGKNNYFFDENIEDLVFRYKFKDGFLDIDEFTAKKSGGSINLRFRYGIEPTIISIWAKANDIPIQELTWFKRLPLNLNGDLRGTLEAEFKNDKWQADSQFKIINTFSNNVSLADSNILIKYHLDEVKTVVDLFSKQIYVDSDFYLLDNKAESSYVNIDLNIPNLKNIVGILSSVDPSNTDLSGRVRYSLRSIFDSRNLKVSHLETNMQNFVLSKKPIFVRYKQLEPEIIIEKGMIKKWDVNIRGRSFYVLSKGKGDLYGNYNTDSQAKIDASIIEVFNSFINKATGNIRANVKYGFKDNKQDYEAYLTSDNLSLVSELIPTAITKSEFKISMRDKVFNIEKLYAQLVSGTLEVSGQVGLKTIVPDINLRYKFKDAGLTLFKKSNLVFSGDGSFVGKTFPYTLGGDYYIESFVLVNEPTDFATGNQSFTKDEIDYLPGKEKQELDQLVNLNLNINTRNPIYVRNSLADMGFTGAVQVTGTEKQPRIGGKVNLAARNNKVTFKNTEFVFSKGNIFFNEQNDYTNPELDFAANTTISEYSVNVKVLGPVKTFNVDLSSEPSLAQSDILSLIAFGYTEDLSNNLTDSERESMTRAGVGSLLFDSFKINETLKKEFGLQINLGTQITQDEASLLSGRNSEGGTANQGRVRSATTIELKKKINDAVSLSVSSTVDTNTQQNRSLNLNYNLNKNVSVEGVYETRNTDDLETINVDNSVGADVKWKWSFK
ncbi:MAG: hypothetical protein CME65_09395 [Halobacteriovoraceae bacterium]|nr:hypothetical protein [Halobacteriovoraceae bacterium]|tara:strand:- start:6093 stop:10118 length:4026 start_codon:yes stop_codon:yes gene_type:complete